MKYKEDDQSWFLYKLYDEVTERYTPIYSAPTETAARLECRDMINKQKNRPFIFIPLGTMSGNEFSNANAIAARFEYKPESDEIEQERQRVFDQTLRQLNSRRQEIEMLLKKVQDAVPTAE